MRPTDSIFVTRLAISAMSSLLTKQKTRMSGERSDRSRAKTTEERMKLIELQQLAMHLQTQLESLNQVPTSTVEEGLDFYTEVSRFEIEMIKRALTVADGQQKKAARLLNLNCTTLNAMMKRYYIKI